MANQKYLPVKGTRSESDQISPPDKEYLEENPSVLKRYPLTIDVEADSTVNLAYQENGVRVIKNIHISNTSIKPFSDIKIVIRSDPPFIFEYETFLTRIRPSDVFTIHDVDIRLRRSFLSAQTERVRGTLRVSAYCGPDCLGDAVIPLDILAYNEWNGLRSLPEILTAFVTPNHPVIGHLLHEAGIVLLTKTGDSSITGYETRNRDRALDITAAIYSAIQNQGILHAYAPAGFEETGLPVRLADRILRVKIGNSLDLTCLIAGCLELAGLHPLIVLTEGHAFCGVWLEEDSFPDPVTDDLVSLRKRVGIGEICVFESTTLASDPPVSFDDSIKRTRTYLIDESRFKVVIDVHATRRGIHRIHPISLQTDSHYKNQEYYRQGRETDEYARECKDNEAVSVDFPEEISVTGERECQSDEDNSGDDISEGITRDYPVSSSSSLPLISEKMGYWKKNLLDLSNRNPLIHFRENKQSLAVLYPNSVSLRDVLADGRSFRIIPLPERDFNGTYPECAEKYLEEYLLDGFAAHRLYTPLQSGKLHERLLSIHKTARLSITENGSATLFLALGFLLWFEAGEPGTSMRSPIVLIPLEIERKSYQEGFTVRKGFEDPQVNVTLLHRLFTEFGFEVPGLDPLPIDRHGIDLAEILYRFKEAIKNIPNWEIQDIAIIGHFSFSKFLMWRELEACSADILKNPLIAHLNNPVEIPLTEQGNLPDPGLLDQEFRPCDTFTPISTDSSQLAAVYAAGLGKTFVLYGPPGTGKSQTITNIIAHCLSLGKTVLFVSEKKVALDVVHDRLKNCNLGPFCLELHSNKSNKREILRQFAQVTGLRESDKNEKWAQQTERLALARTYLNRYVLAVHSVHGSGESYFQGLSYLSGLRNVPYVPLEWDNILDQNGGERSRWREIIGKLQVAGDQCGHPGCSVWNMIHDCSWSIQWKNSVKTIIDELLFTATLLIDQVKAVASLFLLHPQDLSINTLTSCYEIISVINTAGSIPRPLLEGGSLEGRLQRIRKIIAVGKERDELCLWFNERFDQNLLQMNLDAFADLASEAENSGIMHRWYKSRRVRAEIGPFLMEGYEPDLHALESDIRKIALYRSRIQYVNRVQKAAERVFGQKWNDGYPDWDEISHITDIAGHIYEEARRRATDSCNTDELLSAWAGLLKPGEQSSYHKISGDIGNRLISEDEKDQEYLLRQYEETYHSFLSGMQDLNSLLHQDSEAAFGSSSDPNYLQEVISRLAAWQSHSSELNNWAFWCKARKKAEEIGFDPIIRYYEENPQQSSSMTDIANRSYYQWWTEKVRDSDEILRSFIRADFEDELEQFRRLDGICLMICRDEIRSLLTARLPRGDDDQDSAALGILQRQMQLQRNHMPIRTLLQKISPVLPRLKPCMLMSPISVAQYLDYSLPRFDLVIFDEASQIPVWDAIGAISKGDSAIIVGDPKQLPPSTMFERSDDDEEPLHDTQDLESILDECIATRIPAMQLSWHYRSRHESLISFSNYHFYQGSLLTFPSPSKKSAVTLRKVDGVFDRGRSRTNHQEAKAVITEIIRRLCDPVLCLQSIGVVTFNAAQRDLIISLLEKSRRDYPETDQFFHDDRAESVFVKNLENVQGDERDYILFSIGYGPDIHGRISLNFGPLNRDGGERRLNVAITRARVGIIVFSSLRSEDIDLSRTRAEGISLLKSFLAFAERGQAAISETCSADKRNARSLLEEEIAVHLTERGYLVHLHHGCGGYRIDIAIGDPSEPGSFLLGIECDGVNDMMAKNARDRVCLRDDLLRGLGWRIHRVWSTDWWDDPERELHRIDAAIEAAINENRTKLALTPDPTGDDDEDETGITCITYYPEDDGESCTGEEKNLSVMGDPDNPDKFPETDSENSGHLYVRYTRPVLIGDRESFYREESDHEILKILSDIARTEGPVSRESAMKKVLHHWGIRRLGPAIFERIESFYEKAGIQVRDEGYQVFLWHQDQNPDLYSDYRIHPVFDPDPRSYTEIPPQEVANAARHVLTAGGNLSRKELIRSVARLFGMNRISPAGEEVLGIGIDRALSQ